MEFKDRLKNYRLKLGINTKTEMAERLGIIRTLYTMLENGDREPSNDVLEKLLLDSDLPAEYWLYGVTNEKEYLSKREEFKSLKNVATQLREIGLIKAGEEFSESVKEVILAAALADIEHILKKEELEAKEK